MDHQTIFNTAVMGVMTQGRQAFNKDGACALRGADNCKCAVGWLIPDEAYSLDLEEWSQLDLYDGPDELFESPLGEVLAPITGTSGSTFDLLMALQIEHDETITLQEGPSFRAVMMRRFRQVAEQFKLDPGVLNAFAGA